MTHASTSTNGPAITAITLGVRDVSVAARFYTDGLGFPLINRVADDIAFVQAGHGMMLALWAVDQMPSEYGDVGHGPLAPPMSLGHNVSAADEVATWYLRAVDAGAVSVAAPTTQSWGGVSACVADPDGFRWDFVYNPAFEVSPIGEVTGV
ncbi:VOC family protein [Gordonia sp. HY002]|uniref:VOC family protein n=1 Tax=Gordonia zhenghanii TaxID=2911516 RepID=UPI001EF0B115|nr:VOC family protein [Gordonia zhenghanii]MCF8570680.1 VOC family protein [Gordonia zhenghanii]MCF8607642.1 VOC family protein [Gordonia zhenghanii]